MFNHPHDSSKKDTDYRQLSHPIRIDEEKHIHFVTTSCFQRKPLLSEDWARRSALDSLDAIRNKKRFLVLGYVLMPEHAHFLLASPNHDEITKIVGSLKWYISLRLLKEFRNKGIDEKSLWMPRFYDFNVITIEKFLEKLTYCHLNPVKRNLVESPEDWPYSSFRNYEFGDDSVFRVDRWWDFWNV